MEQSSWTVPSGLRPRDASWLKVAPPLAQSEREGLERRLLREGCHDPLVVWKGKGLIIDGQERYRICSGENAEGRVIPFEVREVFFETVEEARAWRAESGLGQRNLDAVGLCESAYELEKLLLPVGRARKRAAGKGIKVPQDPAEARGVLLPLMVGSERKLVRIAEDLLGIEEVYRKSDSRDKACNLAGIKRPTYSNYKKLLEKGRRDLIDAARGPDSKVTLDGAWSQHKAEVAAAEGRKRRQRANARAGSEWTVDEPIWLHGEFQRHVASIPNGSVRLLLTDPPYGMAYRARNKALDRQDIEGDEDVETAANLLAEMLEMMKPKFAEDAHAFIFVGTRQEPRMREVVEATGYLAPRSFPVWVKNNHGIGDTENAFAPKHERALHATVGNPGLEQRPPDVFFAPKVAASKHPTQKPVPLLQQIIRATTSDQGEEVVADPFGGVASTLVAAKSCDGGARRAWGCEMDGTTTLWDRRN